MHLHCQTLCRKQRIGSWVHSDPGRGYCPTGHWLSCVFDWRIWDFLGVFLELDMVGREWVDRSVIRILLWTFEGVLGSWRWIWLSEWHLWQHIICNLVDIGNSHLTLVHCCYSVPINFICTYTVAWTSTTSSINHLIWACIILASGVFFNSRPVTILLFCCLCIQ